jgi:hypothetical protein
MLVSWVQMVPEVIGGGLSDGAFEAFIMCLRGRKKAGTWITHSHAVVCYSNIIMYTICFNIVMERFTMLLSSVNHIFLWAIEKPWLCNK